MSEMSAAAKEAGEEIEWVMVLLLPPAAFVLLEAFMAVLVVDFASLRIGEGFVGRGDFDKFLLGRLVAAGNVSFEYIYMGKVKRTYGFLSGWYFLERTR
jgi:hypothetical protein